MARADDAMEHTRRAIAGYWTALMMSESATERAAILPLITDLTVARDTLAELRATGRMTTDARTTLERSLAVHEGAKRGLLGGALR